MKNFQLLFFTTNEGKRNQRGKNKKKKERKTENLSQLTTFNNYQPTIILKIITKTDTNLHYVDLHFYKLSSYLFIKKYYLIIYSILNYFFQKSFLYRLVRALFTPTRVAPVPVSSCEFGNAKFCCCLARTEAVFCLRHIWTNTAKRIRVCGAATR